MAIAPKLLETLRGILADQIAKNPGCEYELDEENGIIYVSTPAHDIWWGIYSVTILGTVVWSVTPCGRTVLHKPKTQPAQP